jgi:uncharacterized phage-associated protein
LRGAGLLFSYCIARRIHAPRTNCTSGQCAAASNELRSVDAMLINHDREKLCQAIVFFAENTQKLGKTKLFKLLYFLDFEHFKLRGRSVTGMDYFAWPKGPVPKALFEEFEHPAKDLSACAQFSKIPTHRGGMNKVTALKTFDARVFSKRELSIMKSLAERYRGATADEMIEVTHLENRPWHQIYEVSGRRQAKIPYELALNRQEVEEMKRHVRDRLEVIQNYENVKGNGSRNDSF